MANRDETAPEVVVREGTITLPTYALRGQNRNPVFHSQYGVAHIYPYTLLDDIASTPTEKTYRTLILENEHLRVTVLPDLGGRVYSVYDKVSEREVFYKNPVVKFSPLAIRGAFFSGGVEFSFPVAHAPTTADPINWDICENEDGSASVSIGGLEHISGMRWTITLTLFPNRCALAQDVTLHNPSPIPGRYHYWTNASLHSDDQTEFVYPLRRVRSYEFTGTASWPIARLDLIKDEPGLPGMEGVPMWPSDRLQEPFNFRWEKNILAQLSIFGRDVEWDFFGAWQHSSNAGYAHFAHHRDVSGMKLWSWGRTEVGIVNQTALMDDGSLYAETQCGATETHLDFDLLPPGQTRRWREWWLPLRGLGGLTCASADMGARLGLAPGSDEEHVNLTVGICPVYPLDEATVRLSIPDKGLLQETVSISPEKPWLHTAIVETRSLADHPITLSVTDGNGQVVLNYTHDREASPVGPSESVAEEIPETAEDFYELGLKHENFDNRAEALEAYQKALSLSAGHGPAHLRLGLMLLRSADFDGAGTHFRQAVDLGVTDAHYYLGLLSWYGDRPDQAETHFKAVPSGSSISAAASRGLGCIALRRQAWQQAVALFTDARAQEENAISSSVLLALALRRAGQGDEARQVLQSVLADDPLNHLALREMASLEKGEGGPHTASLQRMLADDRQYVLDLACLYLDAGLPGDALSILEEVAQEWDYPMVFYLVGDWYQRLGNEQARRWLAKAQATGPDLVFPSRLWEIKALTQAVEQYPEDYRARYYLGNFLYAHQRFEEGIQLWEEALEGLASFDIIHRNLALAYWQRENNPGRAIVFFEKALELNPQNQDIYIQLDDLYAAQGLRDKREGLLVAMQALDQLREDVRKRIVVMLVDLGRYEEALKILNAEKFVPLEMDQSFHWVYVRALMQSADAHMQMGHIEDAIAEYRKALEFPESLGVGRPTTMCNTEILYRLGCACEKLGKFNEAIAAWQEAASEHHPFGEELFVFVQMSLDKLSRYSELGFPG
jgi:tetratricopeptide (TPR) repeat protein